MNKTKINRYELSKIVLRSFFIQSCWNFNRMQNIGFAFSIFPAIKKIFKSKDKVKKALKRHTEFFNSQPYLSVFAIGAVIKMEEERQPPETIQGFKNSLVGHLGAIGDTFFWASLRPTAALLCLGFALMGQVWAPILFIIIFNVPHIYIRFKGISDGYGMGTEVIDNIKRYQFYKKAYILRDVGMIIAGYLIALSIYFEGALYIPNRDFIIWFSVLNFGMVFFFAVLLKYGIKSIRILWFIILICLLGGSLGLLG